MSSPKIFKLLERTFSLGRWDDVAIQMRPWFLFIPFFVAIPYFMSEADGKLWYFFIIATSIYSGIFLHECGHVWAAWKLGGHPLKIILHHLVETASFESNELRFRSVCLIYFAGPCVNIILGSTALCIHHFIPQPFIPKPLYSDELLLMAYVNFGLGALNLIPIPPLDGGMIIYMMSCRLFGLRKGLIIIGSLGIIFSVFMAIALVPMATLKGLLFSVTRFRLSWKLLKLGIHRQKLHLNPEVLSEQEMEGANPEQLADLS